MCAVLGDAMTGFIPWPNGTSMMRWKDANCDRCAKVGEINLEGVSACAIETALALSAVGPYAVHPTEAEEARRRLKWYESYLEHDCPDLYLAAEVCAPRHRRRVVLNAWTRRGHL